MFRRSTTRYGATPEPVTPYQKAAQIWDERIGSARVQARSWRLMAFGSLFLSAGLGAGLVWQSARGTVTPWVVQVDHLGEAQVVAPATASYRPTDPQIAWYLARFIEDIRSLSSDPVVVRQNWLRAYDFTTTSGAVALNDYGALDHRRYRERDRGDQTHPYSGEANTAGSHHQSDRQYRPTDLPCRIEVNASYLYGIGLLELSRRRSDCFASAG